MIYGIHPVMEALKSKKRNVTQLYVSDSKAGHRAVEEIIRLAKRCNAKIDRIDNKTLDRLTRNANHQGVMAKIQPIKLMKLSTAMYEADGNKKDLWLAVDEMTDRKIWVPLSAVRPAWDSLPLFCRNGARWALRLPYIK